MEANTLGLRLFYIAIIFLTAYGCRSTSGEAQSLSCLPGMLNVDLSGQVFPVGVPIVVTVTTQSLGEHRITTNTARTGLIILLSRDCEKLELKSDPYDSAVLGWSKLPLSEMGVITRNHPEQTHFDLSNSFDVSIAGHYELEFRRHIFFDGGREYVLISSIKAFDVAKSKLYGGIK